MQDLGTEALEAIRLAHRRAVQSGSAIAAKEAGQLLRPYYVRNRRSWRKWLLEVGADDLTVRRAWTYMLLSENWDYVRSAAESRTVTVSWCVSRIRDRRQTQSTRLLFDLTP